MYVRNKKITVFNGSYFTLTLIFLCIEILIGVFAHDRIIRPYVGDLLVVILLYCFIKSFFNLSVLHVVIFVLFFSYLIEFSQYLHLIEILGLQNSKFAKVIMGSSFEWIDLAAYTIGIIIVLIVENIFAGKAPFKTK